MNLEQKINYLESKFNAPMDVIIKAINICKNKNLDIKKIILNKLGQYYKKTLPLTKQIITIKNKQNEKIKSKHKISSKKSVKIR